jgi:hypothetical protein
MFRNFCTFITNEYSKHAKTNHSTAKSVGFGIANVACEVDNSSKVNKKTEMTMVAKIVQNMQKENNKKLN